MTQSNNGVVKGYAIYISIFFCLYKVFTYYIKLLISGCVAFLWMIPFFPSSIDINTGCSLNIVFSPYNVVIFLNSASSAAALVCYLPGVCTHTDTEGKQRKTRVWTILKSLEKKNNI